MVLISINNDVKRIYVFFILLYVFLGVQNYFDKSQWLFDNVISVVFLTIALFLLNWLKIRNVGFVMFNIALLLHNLGSFGFYSWSYGIFGYDNIVHFCSSLAAGYIVFNFIARKMHIKKKARVKSTVVDEHTILLILLVFASVAMMGVFIELLEFGGFVFLGEGDGLFFVGAGDSANAGDMFGQYMDTMSDIIVNTLGTLAGVLLYYYWQYKKKPWIKY